MMSRFILALATLFVTAAAMAQTPTATPDLPLDGRFGITTIPLYAAQTSPDAPTLTVFIPQKNKGNGTAIIIAPGGGYQMLAMNIEGAQVADWFRSRGVTAFVLRYRYGPNNLFPVPLEDAQQALRLVRSLAPQYSLDPARVGMIGFSAGGHLSAAASVFFHDAVSNPPDPISRFSDRPDFVILGYPWMNAMMAPINGKINYCHNMKLDPSCKAYDAAYTPALHVRRNTPPTFIYSTTDDPVVPIAPTVDYYKALVAAGVPVEMHLFRHGSHGTGLGTGDAALDQWPMLMEQWMRDQGWLTKSAPLKPVTSPDGISK